MTPSLRHVLHPMASSRPLALALAALALGLALAAPSFAVAPRIRGTASVGFPNDGKLVGGRRVQEGLYLRFATGYAKSPAKFAIRELGELLERASRRVARKYPGAVMQLGDVSARDGGPLAAHHSHQSGRDADVGFYLLNQKGRVARYERFVPCDGEGKARNGAPLRFDEARNWALVAAMLEDRSVQVRSIFVYAPLRARLLAFAEHVGAPKALREHAAMVMSQPPNAAPHDDHFHVRIACPAAQRALGCIDDSRAKGPGESARVARAKARGAGATKPPASGETNAPAADEPPSDDAPAADEAAPAEPAEGAASDDSQLLE